MPADLPTTKADKPLLSVLKGRRRDPRPVWMMRQAGRYLPGVSCASRSEGRLSRPRLRQRRRGRDHASAAEALSRARCRDPFLRHPDRSVRDRPEPDFCRGRGTAPDPNARGPQHRCADHLSGQARPDLRDGGQGQSRARSGQDADRFCRQPVDRRDLHGGRPRQPRPCRGEAHGLCRSPGLCRDHLAHRRGSRSIICRGRSRPVPTWCNCSTAGPGAWRRRNSSNG